jgi:hypothetical protein
MQQLSQQEPTRFNTVARQVAASFRQAASQASGVDAQSLTHLATQFALAAQSGRLQPLPTTGSRAPDPPRGGIQSAGPSGGSIAPRSYRPDDGYAIERGGASVSDGCRDPCSSYGGRSGLECVVAASVSLSRRPRPAAPRLVGCSADKADPSGCTSSGAMPDASRPLRRPGWPKGVGRVTRTSRCGKQTPSPSSVPTTGMVRTPSRTGRRCRRQTPSPGSVLAAGMVRTLRGVFRAGQGHLPSEPAGALRMAKKAGISQVCTRRPFAGWRSILDFDVFVFTEAPGVATDASPRGASIPSRCCSCNRSTEWLKNCAR